MITCASPTCRATVTISAPRQGGKADVAWWLNKIGWSLEQQPGDDRPMPYCERCKL